MSGQYKQLARLSSKQGSVQQPVGHKDSQARMDSDSANSNSNGGWTMGENVVIGGLASHKQLGSYDGWVAAQLCDVGILSERRKLLSAKIFGSYLGEGTLGENTVETISIGVGPRSNGCNAITMTMTHLCQDKGAILGGCASACMHAYAWGKARRRAWAKVAGWIRELGQLTSTNMFCRMHRRRR